MKRVVVIISLILVFFLPEILFGQQYTFHFFNESEGLHYARHTNMVKDKQGYLWIGSHNGLRRYDGHRFITLGSGAVANIQMPFTDAGKIYLLSNGLIALLEQDKDLGIVNPETFEYKQLNLDVYASHDNRVVAVSQDADSVLYLYIQSPKGLYVVGYDGKQQSVIYHKEQANRKMVNTASRYQNLVYLVSFNQKKYLFYDWQEGYFWLDKNTHKLSPFELPESIVRANPAPFFIIRDARGKWLFSFNILHGIYTLNSQQKIVRDTVFSSRYEYCYVQPTGEGKLLFSTYTKKHLYIHMYNPVNQQVERINNLRFNSWDVMEPWSDDADHYLYISGSAGFVYGGIRDFYLSSCLRKAPNNSTGISVRGMIKIAPGKVMVTTERNGIYIYNIDENSCKQLKSPTSWPNDLQPATFTKNLLTNHKGKIYFSAYSDTPSGSVPKGYLVVYDTINGFESYHKLPFRIENMILESDTSILAAAQSYLYRIGLFPGIHFSPVKLGSQIKDVRLFLIEKMVKTSSGILLATNQGLFRLEKSGLKKIGLPGTKTDHYYDVFEDSKGILWIATYGDCLYRFDPKKDGLKRFNEESGFKSDVVVGIVPEDSTRLWVSTYNGIYLFNKKKFYARELSSNAGIDQEEFNRYSYLKFDDKNWLFGGMNGLIRIRQRENKLHNIKSRILFSSATFRIPGKPQDTTVYTPEQIPLLLSSSNRKITLAFGLLNPDFGVNPSAFYRILPPEKKWTKLPLNKELTLNYIPPGSYVLQLALSDLQYSKQIRFGVQYFLYEHLWFKLLMFIAMALIVTFFVYVFFDRRLARIKAKKLAENEYFRHRLFTYIVHEFKTPLTVISGISKKIKSNRETLEQNIDNIQRQSEQMNELVEQMLELNQVDSGSWIPELKAIDIPVFIERLCTQLQLLAEEMEIKMVCSSSVQSLVQLTDASKLRAILNNLITNALKYSPKNSTVNVLFEKTNQNWSITVRDQGSGINESELSHIFELFYKGSFDSNKQISRSGIGLAYVKTTVEALGGRMEVFNDEGAVFKIFFPVSEPQAMPENTVNEQSELQRKVSKKGDRYSILLVEDTKDIAQYVISCFDEDKFQVSWKKNGKAGMKFAIEKIPDLIITDARMPEMNGFEMIRMVKKEEITCHIPIIMLTALSGEGSRIKGLESGADAYISKPFSEEELILTVNNILSTIEKQKKLMAVRLTGQSPVSNEYVSKSELFTSDKFVAKVYQCLQENYSNTEFTMADMARELAMSRAQMYRKLKTVSGLNPNDMLGLYRLNRAAELLADKGLSISEIAYACGFSDSSYFSKMFKKEFGKTPTRYREHFQ